MRITIVEDHGLIAHTLARALVARGHAARTIDPRGSDDLPAAVLDDDPDLVLLDLDLGAQGDATDLIPPIVDAQIPVLMVTGVDDPVRRSRCIAAGAVGLLEKSGSFEELVDVIDRVAHQETLLTGHEREEHLRLLRDHRRAERRRLAPFEDLTPREATVLGELMRGRTIEQIAAAAFVSKDTVRTQVRAVRTKLGVRSQVAAVAKATEAGWEPPRSVD